MRRRTLIQGAIAALAPLPSGGDDTARLQALIDAARPIRAGLYRLSSQLKLREGMEIMLEPGATMYVIYGYSCDSAGRRIVERER